MTTHIASIGTALDVVDANVCDLTIVTAEFAGMRYDNDGNEIAEYTPTTITVFSADLTVPAGANGDPEQAVAEADQILHDNGWTRSTNWTVADNAMYADVIDDPAA